jgi:hypothetical protein
MVPSQYLLAMELLLPLLRSAAHLHCGFAASYAKCTAAVSDTNIVDSVDTTSSTSATIATFAAATVATAAAASIATVPQV